MFKNPSHFFFRNCASNSSNDILLNPSKAIFAMTLEIFHHSNPWLNYRIRGQWSNLFKTSLIFCCSVKNHQGRSIIWKVRKFIPSEVAPFKKINTCYPKTLTLYWWSHWLRKSCSYSSRNVIKCHHFPLFHFFHASAVDIIALESHKTALENGCILYEQRRGTEREHFAVISNDIYTYVTFSIVKN